MTKPGGHLILSTFVNRTDSFTEYNGFRVYGLPAIRELLSGYEVMNEQFFSRKGRQTILEQDVISGIEHRRYDLYLFWGRKKETSDYAPAAGNS